MAYQESPLWDVKGVPMNAMHEHTPVPSNDQSLARQACRLQQFESSPGHVSSVSGTVCGSKCHKKVHMVYLLESSQEGICSVIDIQHTIPCLLLIYGSIKGKSAVASVLHAMPSAYFSIVY
jgi:hypothetical protein